MNKQNNISAWFQHILDLIEDKEWRDLELLIDFCSYNPDHDFLVAWKALNMMEEE